MRSMSMAATPAEGACRADAEIRPQSNEIHGSGHLQLRVRDNFIVRCLIVAALLATGAGVIPSWGDFAEGQRARDAKRYDDALAEWRAAADDGDARAMLSLGRLFRAGLGVPQDHVLAHMWFNLAASRGQAEAGPERDALGRKMEASERAEAQCRAREWRPGAWENDLGGEAVNPCKPWEDVGSAFAERRASESWDEFYADQNDPWGRVDAETDNSDAWDEFYADQEDPWESEYNRTEDQVAAGLERDRGEQPMGSDYGSLLSGLLGESSEETEASDGYLAALDESRLQASRREAERVHAAAEAERDAEEQRRRAEWEARSAAEEARRKAQADAEFARHLAQIKRDRSELLSFLAQARAEEVAREQARRSSHDGGSILGQIFGGVKLGVDAGSVLSGGDPIFGASDIIDTFMGFTQGSSGTGGLGSGLSPAATQGCTPLPAQCQRAQQSGASRASSLAGRGSSTADAARASAELHRIAAETYRACYSSESRPNCKQIYLQQMRQAERGREEALRIVRQVSP